MYRRESLAIDCKIDVNFDNTYPVMKSLALHTIITSIYVFIYLKVITGMVWLCMGEVKLHIHIIYILWLIFVLYVLFPVPFVSHIVLSLSDNSSFGS